MRIKSDVEFVKKECEAHDCGWLEEMECRCGENVVKIKNESETKLKCFFSDGDWWYYPLSCIEGLTTLEKGKKYTIAAGEAPMTFVEESENFAIFEGGIALKKDGNEFVEVAPEPRFLNEEWEVRVSKREGTVHVLCGGFYVAEITKDGLRHVMSLPENIGFALDNQRAAKLVKS